jgi:uncharacterized membrane protein
MILTGTLPSTRIFSLCCTPLFLFLSISLFLFLLSLPVLLPYITPLSKHLILTTPTNLFPRNPRP